MSNLQSIRARRRRRGRVTIAASLASCLAVVAVASAAIGGFNPFRHEKVGHAYAYGILLPTNQWISPLGTRILDRGARVEDSVLMDGVCIELPGPHLCLQGSGGGVRRHGRSMGPNLGHRLVGIRRAQKPHR